MNRKVKVKVVFLVNNFHYRALKVAVTFS